MEGEFVVSFKDNIVGSDDKEDRTKKLGRERWQRRFSKNQAIKSKQKKDKADALRKEKKHIKNLTAKWRSTLSPTGKLMDQLSFKDVHHVLAGLSALCALFRVCSDVDSTQQRSNAILIVNDGLLYELYACLHKRIENVSVAVLGSELFASVLSLYPFSERCTTLRSTEKPWYDGHGKLFYDLFFVVIKR